MTGIFNILVDLFLGGVYFFIAVLVVLTLRKLLHILIKNKIARKKVLFYLPLIEFAAFFGILIGTSYALISDDKIIGLIIVLVLLVSMWKFLLNYISGIVFRLTNRNITGSMVKVDETEGRVSAYLMTSIALKNQKEEVIKIPYVLFYNKYTTSSINTESTVKQSFVFELKTDGKNIEKKVKAYLQSSPWVVLSKEIEVNFSPNSSQLSVTFYSLSSAYEMELKKELEDLL